MQAIPKVIPPRSKVRLVKADGKTPPWRKQIGRQFRVGYYNRKDGLDCIWLVNDSGEYEQTTDRNFLLKYFVIEQISDEKDYYGQKKRRLGRIRLVTRLNRRRSMGNIGKRTFHLGDKVRVVGIPKMTFASGVRDKMGTGKLFKSMLGKVYTVRGFDKIGNIELEPKRLNTVWIEPEFLKLRARKPTTWQTLSRCEAKTVNVVSE